MKTMTCKDMGGPCDASFQGKKADEVIKAQDSHLKQMVATGDETHQSAPGACRTQVEASDRRHGLVSIRPRRPLLLCRRLIARLPAYGHATSGER